MSQNIKVSDIVAVIEEFAPACLAESYDNTGLLIGDNDNKVTKLITCVDVIEEVVDEAIECGADMILSHHPLIFSGLKSLTGKNYIERSVIKMLKNNISLYCAHTSIDSTLGGISYAMGSAIGLEQMQTLSTHTQQGEGFGVVGELKDAVDTMELLQHIKEVFGCGVIRHTSPHKKMVKKIAMCGGSGASLICEAKNVGAELYISADFKYHDFFETENCITVADIGHFESEKVVLDIFSDIISKKYSTFAVCKSKIVTNPVKYL